MSRHDWFQNELWNSEIELAFEAKLRRSRNKTHYLRLQAGHLAKTHPVVALAMVDRYLNQGGDISLASAHAIRADAHLSLGNVTEAVDAYETALKREQEFPNLRTRAFIDLPKLIVDLELTDRYPRALELLEEAKPQIVFAVDRYVWAGATALILHELGRQKRLMRSRMKPSLQRPRLTPASDIIRRWVWYGQHMTRSEPESAL